MYIPDKSIKDLIKNRISSVDHFEDYDAFDDWKNKVILDLIDEYEPHLEAYSRGWDMKYILLENRVDKIFKEMKIDENYEYEDEYEDFDYGNGEEINPKNSSFEIVDSRADVLESTIADIANRFYSKKNKYGLGISQKDLDKIIYSINDSQVFKRLVEQCVRDWIKTNPHTNV